MAKSMTKSQIVSYLASKAGISKKKTLNILDNLATLAKREAKNTFIVPGIGKLMLAERKARIGRNPQTGKTRKSAVNRVVKFRIAKSMKMALPGGPISPGD